MPHDLFLIRLIHHATRKPFPGERIWTPTELLNPATVRFLRIRNREGCDVYVWPFAEKQNAGYILLDLDQAAPSVLEVMRGNGHEPCVVLQTSPGHLQAWIHISTLPLEPAMATRSASTWPVSMEETWPAPIGVTWEDLLGSLIRSRSGSQVATLPG
jgi:hypothetical protein